MKFRRAGERRCAFAGTLAEDSRFRFRSFSLEELRNAKAYAFASYEQDTVFLGIFTLEGYPSNMGPRHIEEAAKGRMMWWFRDMEGNRRYSHNG